MQYGVRILFSLYPNEDNTWCVSGGEFMDDHDLASYDFATPDINKAFHYLNVAYQAYPDHLYVVEEKPDEWGNY